MSKERLFNLLEKVKNIGCGGVYCVRDNCPFNFAGKKRGCALGEIETLAEEHLKLCPACDK